MPRLTKDQWSAARIKWESDPAMTDHGLAEILGVSKQAVEQQRKKNEWYREYTIEQIIDQEYRKAENKIARAKKRAEDRANRRLAEIAALREHAGKASNDKLAGFVYLMTVSAGGEVWYKIGRASRVKDRLSVVQSGCPWTVSVVSEWLVADAAQTEKMLHAMFSDKRAALVSGLCFPLATLQKLCMGLMNGKAY